MKHFLYIFIIISVTLLASSTAEAASFKVVAPERAPTNGEPFSVIIMLDTEGETVSGVEGILSFDKSLFSIDSISTENSIVTPWVGFPRVSDERYFDNRLHITFEGIFAGGFGGVKSAYYKGAREGKLFTVVLRPKSFGETTLVLDSLSLRSFNELATEIPVSNVIKKVGVAPGTKIVSEDITQLRRFENQNLSVVVAKSDLVGNGALYLVIDDKEPRSSIVGMYVAESETYNGDLVNPPEWHTARNPYVLLSQNRSNYIHVKVVYSDNTYTIKTIEPVDNIQATNGNSHILVFIGMLIVALCLYAYARKFKIIPSHTP